MLEVPREQHEFELTQLAPVGSALFRLVKQLVLDFCANGLVGRQQARPSRHHSLFFWFSVSPFLLGRVKR
jgi:hypothetical protein